MDCRVRILLREGREIYYATLGVVENGDTKILCSYKCHGTEPNWHCHAKCGEIEDITLGQNRFGSIRLPYARSRHRRKMFGVTKLTAISVATDFYGLKQQETERQGLLL
jgi:hypothetical protein